MKVHRGGVHLSFHKTIASFWLQQMNTLSLGAHFGPFYMWLYLHSAHKKANLELRRQVRQFGNDLAVGSISEYLSREIHITT